MNPLSRWLAALALAAASACASAQSLSVSPASAIAGTSVSAIWSGVSAPTATDWVGLYVPGAGHTAHLAWRYTSGSASGSVPFTLPLSLASGTYELRLFANNANTLLATSGALAITGASLALGQSVVPPGQALQVSWSDIGAPTATDWIGLYVDDQPHSAHLAWRYTTGAASGSVPFTVPASTPPGAYELRLFSNNVTTLLAKSTPLVVPTPVISASVTSLVAGEALIASWSNIGVPAASDWIGLYAPGATTYLAWVYTTGTSNGAVPFTVPASVPAGTYELRLRAAGGVTLATSATFTVTPAPPPVLQASPAIVNPGGALLATWSNIASPAGTDWIGLYVPGTPNSAYLDYRYTGGTAAGSIPFPIGAGQAPGTYELRLLAAGQVLLASSATFTVQPPPKAISGTLTKAGAPLAGVIVLGTGVSCSPSNASGQYTCTVPHGWSGTLTPSASGNVFAPAERSYANVTADQAAQDFAAQTGGASMTYIHTDHLNTPRLVADSAGSTVWKWDQQEPFGVNVPDENPSGLGAFEFPLGFAGTYRDNETGLLQNWHRELDTSRGQYLQSDPLGLRAGLNTFAHVDNDPLLTIDPNGLQALGGRLGGGLRGGSGLGVGSTTDKQKSGQDPYGGLGEYMQPGSTPGPSLPSSVSPEEAIAGVPVPPFPGLGNLAKDCSPGKRIVFVILTGRHKGRTNVEQEYQCSGCGLVTRHTIITPTGKVVHDHFRPGPARGTADD